MRRGSVSTDADKTARKVWRWLMVLMITGTAVAWAVACAALKTAEPSATAQQQSAQTLPRLKLHASSRFAHRATANDTPVGGLSGITHDAARGQFYAISDDRSRKAAARFYRLQWQPTSPMQQPVITGVTTLLAADGKPFPAAVDSSRPNIPVVDAEAIRYHPQRDTLFWSSEGDVRRGLPPFVAESRLDGSWLRAFALPKVLANAFANGQMRNNATFEGLALSHDGNTLWVGMEGALRQDSDEPDTNTGALLRFTAFDVDSGKASKQVLYRTDPLPFIPLGYSSMGVTELDFDPQGNLLVLERAYMAGVGLSVRLYRVLAEHLAAAADVMQQEKLPQQAATLPKTRVINFNHSGLRPLDNMEGMCQWQPGESSTAHQDSPHQGQNAVEQKQPSHEYMLFVTDNNFNPIQVTQLSAFVWSRK